MRSLVVDASAGIAIVRRDPEGHEARAVLAGRASDRLLVPPVFWLEVVNVLARRYGYSGASVLEAVHVLDELEIETIEADRTSLLMVIDLVERHGLAAYDAAYLALAEVADADLLTADRRLALAAADRAVLIAGGRSLADDRVAYQVREPTWPMWHDAGAYLARLRSTLPR
jgi:predicted nucleic acid-binding protein